MASSVPGWVGVARRHAIRGETFDRCRDASIAVGLSLKEEGYDARLLRCRGLAIEAPQADPRWRNLGHRRHWTHYLVAIGDQVCDLTRRQFFPNSDPIHIAPVSELEAEWEKIEWI